MFNGYHTETSIVDPAATVDPAVRDVSYPNTVDSLIGQPAAQPPAEGPLDPGAHDDFLEFYGLKSNPFSDSVNPAFFYRAERHEEACIRMMLAVRNDLSVAMITGRSGTGKTLVSQMVLSQLDPSRFQPVLVLVSPGLSRTGLLREILSELNVAAPPGPFVSTRDLLKVLGDAIIDLHQNGRKLVLLIDEAHFLSADCLHILRTISNIETPERKLVTCLLFGENRLLKRLEHPSFDSLRNRMYMRSELGPLSEQESEQYVKFRLLVAGRIDDLFEPAALAALHAASGGICRNISKLGMLALLEGFVQRRTSIDAATVNHCAAAL